MAEVVRRAGQACLDVLALTDHDTLADQAAPRQALGGVVGPEQAPPPGLTLVTGMELSCRLEGHSGGVHMLAYGLAAAEGSGTRRGVRRDRGLPAQPRPADGLDRLRELGVDISWPQVEAFLPRRRRVVGRRMWPGRWWPPVRSPGL